MRSGITGFRFLTASLIFSLLLIASVSSFAVDNDYSFNPFTSQLDLKGDKNTVIGPSGGSSTDNAIARWDGTTGTLLQDSGVTIDDSDNLTTSATIRADSGFTTESFQGAGMELGVGSGSFWGTQFPSFLIRSGGSASDGYVGLASGTSGVNSWFQWHSGSSLRFGPGGAADNPDSVFDEVFTIDAAGIHISADGDLLTMGAAGATDYSQQWIGGTNIAQFYITTGSFLFTGGDSNFSDSIDVVGSVEGDAFFLGTTDNRNRLQDSAGGGIEINSIGKIRFDAGIGSTVVTIDSNVVDALDNDFQTGGNFRVDTDSGRFKAGVGSTDYLFGWDGSRAIHTIVAGWFEFSGGSVRFPGDIEDGSNIISISPNSRAFYNSSGSQTLEYDSGTAQNSSSQTTIDWNSEMLIDRNAVGSIDWFNRTGTASNTNVTFDYENKQLSSSNSIVLDWGNLTLNDIGASGSLDWGNRQFLTANADTIFDYSVDGLADFSDSVIKTTSLTASLGVYTDASQQLTSTPPTSGILGYWSRAGTTISTASAGDDVAITGELNVGVASTVGIKGKITLGGDENAADGAELNFLEGTTNGFRFIYDGLANNLLGKSGNPTFNNWMSVNRDTRIIQFPSGIDFDNTPVVGSNFIMGDDTTDVLMELRGSVNSATAAEIRILEQSDATSGELGGYLLFDGSSNDFRIGTFTGNDTRQEHIVLPRSNHNVEMPFDNAKFYQGTGNDSYLEFDGDSMNIVANAITSTDTLDISSGGVNSDNLISVTDTTNTNGYLLAFDKRNYNLSTAPATQIGMNCTIRASTGGSRAMRGLLFDMRYLGSGTQTGAIQGALYQIYNTGSGNTGANFGISGELYQANNGTASSFTPIRSRGNIVNTNTGTVTTYIGMLDLGMDAEDGTVVNAYNFYGSAHKVDTGALTNAYGLYLAKQTAGGTINRGIWLAGDGIGSDISLGATATDYQLYSDGTRGLISNATGLDILNSVAGTAQSTQWFTNDGDGTDDNFLKLWAVGTQADQTNSESLTIGYYGDSNTYDIFSQETGSGTTRDIYLYTDVTGQSYSQIGLFASDGSTKIGDANGTDYVNFAADGEINLAGNARVKKEISLQVFSVPKGLSAPSDALRAIGASGNVKDPVVQFSKVTEQEVHFVFHMPNDVDDSVNVSFHLMWLPGDSWTTGNYMWKLEYLIKNEDDDSTTGAPTTISADVTPANADDYIETEFATTIDINSQQMLIGRFYRDVANDNADDTGDAKFGEIEYTCNKLGTAL